MDNNNDNIEKFFGLYFILPNSRFHNQIVMIINEKYIKTVNEFLLNKVPVYIGWDYEPISDIGTKTIAQFRTESMENIAFSKYIKSNKRKYGRKKYDRPKDI